MAGSNCWLEGMRGRGTMIALPRLLRCALGFRNGSKPAPCSTSGCLLSPAADILRGKIILDVLAGPGNATGRRPRLALAFSERYPCGPMSLHPPGFIEPCLPTGSQTVPTVRNEGVPWLKAKSLAASASFPDYQRTEAVAWCAAGETLASIARWLPHHRQ